MFPPFPAAIIALTLYKVLSFILPESVIVLFVAGGLVGKESLYYYTVLLTNLNVLKQYAILPQ